MAASVFFGRPRQIFPMDELPPIVTISLVDVLPWPLSMPYTIRYKGVCPCPVHPFIGVLAKVGYVKKATFPLLLLRYGGIRRPSGFHGVRANLLLEDVLRKSAAHASGAHTRHSLQRLDCALTGPAAHPTDRWPNGG
jgi:hypothetical protein